ncbi:MAG: hypothetical protein HY721_10040 [Planctomycetes bacterium]|nr:hypothetical protein [Planctomycetota bacterium]
MTTAGKIRKGDASDAKRCSFCDQALHEVTKLIAGRPGVFICDRCVEICHRILHDEHLKPPPAGKGAGPAASVLAGAAAGVEHAARALEGVVTALQALSKGVETALGDDRRTAAVKSLAKIAVAKAFEQVQPAPSPAARGRGRRRR